jgi:hypothetical protein
MNTKRSVSVLLGLLTSNFTIARLDARVGGRVELLRVLQVRLKPLPQLLRVARIPQVQESHRADVRRVLQMTTRHHKHGIVSTKSACPTSPINAVGIASRTTRQRYASRRFALHRVMDAVWVAVGVLEGTPQLLVAGSRLLPTVWRSKPCICLVVRRMRKNFMSRQKHVDGTRAVPGDSGSARHQCSR